MENLQTLQEELEQLENMEFMLQMADHWDNDDYELSRELHEKIKTKKEEIEKCKTITI